MKEIPYIRLPAVSNMGKTIKPDAQENTRKMKLVLFDIDGTLLDSGGAGSRALNAAFRELFSIDKPPSGTGLLEAGLVGTGLPFEGIRMAGKTDTEIVMEGFRKHGIEADGKMPLFMDAYIRHLKLQVDNPGRRLKPGVKMALNALGVMEGVALGLLTGNIEDGARIKLEAFGLNGYFQFGAFGSDSADRNRLLPIALGRFNQKRNGRLDKNERLAAADCTVVGDTPRDVQCAKLHGAHAIAVATGGYTSAELLKTEADHILEDLADTGLFLKCLGF